MYTYWYLSEHCAPRRNCTNASVIFFTEGVVNEFVAVALILVYWPMALDEIKKTQKK